MKKVGMLTVGQAPRTDVIPDLDSIRKLGFTFIECGVLDKFSYDEVLEKFSPEAGNKVLITRMGDGRQVTICWEKIYYLIQECITYLESENCEAIVFLSTGDFPEFEHTIPIIEPGDLLRSITSELVANGPIGVIVADQGQIEHIKQKWSSKNIKTVLVVASPYTGVGLEKAAQALLKAKVKLIFLDGIGYTLKMKQKVREITGLPVLSPRTMIARILEEME